MALICDQNILIRTFVNKGGIVNVYSYYIDFTLTYIRFLKLILTFEYITSSFLSLGNDS